MAISRLTSSPSCRHVHGMCMVYHAYAILHAHAHATCTHHAHPTQEQLEALAEAYADPAAEKVESDDEGDAEID